MNPVFSEIAKSGIIIPVFASGLSTVKPSVAALSKGGIFCAEADITSPVAYQIVSEIRTAFPEILVGLGKISSQQKLEEALTSDASFYTVSCDLFLKAPQNVRGNFIPVCAMTDEIQRVVSAGCALVQISAKMENIKEIFSLYKNIRFILSEVKEMAPYVMCPQVAALKLEMKKDMADSAVYTRAIETLLGYDLRHVGINSNNAEESAATAEQFEFLFGFPKEDRGGAYFAGNVIEVMKKPFYGKHGHIAIVTNSAARAAYYLEKKGVALNWQSAGYNPDGSLRVVYLQKEVGGFALHILQK